MSDIEKKVVNADGSIKFSCRSPIYMCANCTHAERCQDLLNILRLFKVEEVQGNFDYVGNFPFIEDREGEKDPRNKRNELSSTEWLNFTRTAIAAKLPNILGHELRRKHPGYKSPILFGQLISFFTQKNDIILDPFAGTGSSLIAAAMLERDGIGFETDSRWIDVYKEICEKENIKQLKMIQADSSHLSVGVNPSSIDFIIIDPPDPMATEEWAGMEAPPSLDIYFGFMTRVLRGCIQCLKKKKHVALITRNHYFNGKYYLMSTSYAEAAEKAGFVLKGEKVWVNAGEKLKPYGYPHSYVPNIVHMHLLFFQKPEEEFY